MTLPGSPALDQALAARRDPSVLPRLRERPLPEGMGMLLRVAAGERSALERASQASGESEASLVEAAQIFIQQAMFFHGADSFRVLGLAASADDAQIKEHRRWLLRWLHPDRDAGDWNSVYADRVNQAWQQVRTAEQRSRYAGPAPPGREEGAPSRPLRSPRPVLDLGGLAYTPRSVRRMPALILSLLALAAVLGLVAQATLGGRDEFEVMRGATHPAQTDTAGTAQLPPARVEPPRIAAASAVAPATAPAVGNAPPSTDAARQLADVQAAERELAAQALATATATSTAAATAKLAEQTRAAHASARAALAEEKLAADTLAARKLAAQRLVEEGIAAQKLAALAAQKLAAQKLAALAAQKLAAEQALLDAKSRDKALAKALAKAPAAPGKTAAKTPAAGPPASRAEPDKTQAIATANVSPPPAAAAAPAPQRRNASMNDARAADMSRRFREAYASGDIERIRGLLTRDKLFRRSDRREILKNYEALFAASQSRRIELRQPSWINQDDGTAVMIATFEAWITAPGGKPVRSVGDIRFDLRREDDGQMRITRLRHKTLVVATAGSP